MAANVRRWWGSERWVKPITPNRSARASAAAMAERNRPSTGRGVTVRTASSPGSLTHPMIYATASSRSTSRHSGSATA